MDVFIFQFLFGVEFDNQVFVDISGQVVVSWSIFEGISFFVEVDFDLFDVIVLVIEFQSLSDMQLVF